MKYAKKVIILLFCFVLTFVTVAPASTQAATTIQDVPKTNSKYEAILWAINNDLMTTDNANNFLPTGQVTEQDVVQIFAKLDKNYALSTNASVAYNFYSDFYLPFEGTTSTTNRLKTITRGQFARIYAAFKGLDLDEPQAVQYLYMNEISTGSTGKKTFADFKSSTRLTRGDLAVFLYRAVQKETFAVQGLKKVAIGRDNDEITLPVGFMGSTGAEFEKPKDTVNDFVGPSYVNEPIQSVEVENADLIANGVDKTFVTVSLKACNGYPIADDKSYKFRVTSLYGAKIVDKNGESIRYVQSDGSNVTAQIIAPKLTKSVRDVISFELIENTDANMSCFVGQKINAYVSYTPKAELRINYEVYDPQNSNEIDGDITPPATLYEKLPAYFTEGLVNVHWLNALEKKFSIGQKISSNSALVNTQYLQYGGGDVRYPALGYQNAILQFDNYTISVYLFEQIINQRLKNSIIGEKTTELMYMISNDGRPIYRIQGIDSGITSQVEKITSVASIIQLMGYMPEEKNLSLEHYDSVMKIYAILSSLSEYERTVLLKYQGGKLLGQVEAYKKRVEALKESADAAARPDGKSRYTKAIVTLVSPGGEIITDYQGSVKITFDGVEKTASFVTNTSDYVTGTGNPGAAVVYFDSLVYGNSKIEAELVGKVDSRYSLILSSLTNTTISKTIFTNPPFKENACTLETEVAYVVDYSGSMKRLDPTNYRGTELRKVIERINAKNNIVVETNNKARLLTSGSTEDVLKTSLYNNSIDRGGTDIFAGIELAISKFSTEPNTSKAIIVVSDGFTTKSKMNQVIKDAKNKGIKIYTVTTGKKGQYSEAILAQLASDTGGTYYHALDKLQMHNVYQDIIESILCQKKDSSCINPEELFEESTVSIRNGNVTMFARLSSTCPNIANVIVRYSSISGDIQFTLTKRSDNVFMLTKNVQVLQDFNVNTEVEFMVYDKANHLLNSKKVTISNL